MDRRLVELCDRVAAADAEGERASRRRRSRAGSRGDSMPPRIGGYAAVGITCRDADGVAPRRHLPTDTPEAIDRGALERAHAFALELIRRLDADLGRAAADR